MGKERRKMRSFIAFLLLTPLVLAQDPPKPEHFSGNGTIHCFGRMTVQLDVPRPGARSGKGNLTCSPWFSPTVAPQGFIIDGEDNSHWVIVDDNGAANCTGELDWHDGDWGMGYCPKNSTETGFTLGEDGDQFCGGANCVGSIDATCHDMFMGCHGPQPKTTTTTTSPKVPAVPRVPKCLGPRCTV